jgi:CheY-like chemotaxis protein
MVKLTFLLMLAAGLGCLDVTRGQAQSAARVNLDRAMKGHVEEMAKAPVIEKPGPNYRMFVMELGVLVVGLIAFRNWATPIGSFLTNRFGAKDTMREAKLSKEEQSVSEFEARLQPDSQRNSDSSLGPLGDMPLAAGDAEDFALVFTRDAVGEIESVRKKIEAVLAAEDVVGLQTRLEELYIGLDSLASNASCARRGTEFRLVSAIQKLIKKFIERPGLLTMTAFDTAKAALGVLEGLCALEQSDCLLRQPPRLLIVDDDPTARRAISMVVQLGFAKPSTADCGEAAIALAKSDEFDAVFMDIQMPGMNGFEACKKLLKKAPNRQVSVVFLTSRDDAKSREEAAAVGGCGFIPKSAQAVEVALAAITFALRTRLKKLKAEQAAARPSINNKSLDTDSLLTRASNGLLDGAAFRAAS